MALEEQRIEGNGVHEPTASGVGAVWPSGAEFGCEQLELLPCLALVVRSELVVASNEMIRQVTGWSGDELVGCQLDGWLLERPPGHGFDESSTSRGRVRFESRLRRQVGLSLEVSAASHPIHFGSVPAILVTLLEHEVQRPLWGGGDSTFLGDVLEGVPGASVLTDGGRVVHVNHEFTRVFGYSYDDASGRDLDELVLPEGRLHEVEMLEHELDKQGRATLQTERRTSSGQRLEVEVMMSRLRLRGEARGMLVSYRDIREQKKEEARLQHSALHCALTGLPNRRLFLDRAELMLARLRRRPSRGFALFFLDLDGFKKVNDELGHAAGDALLLTMADRLKSCLRPQDTVARFGGDEFALLLDESGTESELQLLAGRLQAEIGEPFLWMGREARVGASIGIAKAGSYATAEQMLSRADEAMYVAKNAGKRQFSMARE